jgi:hypothetical protein
VSATATYQGAHNGFSGCIATAGTTADRIVLHTLLAAPVYILREAVEYT